MSANLSDHAQIRATDLLLSYLSPHQRFTYVKNGFFYVQGQDGRVYLIVGNGFQILELEEGAPLHVWGIASYTHGYGSGFYLPRADLLLAQMLLVKTNIEMMKHCACKDASHYNVPIVILNRRYYSTFIEELRGTSSGEPRSGAANRWQRLITRIKQLKRNLNG